jgi:hypothetical protein
MQVAIPEGDTGFEMLCAIEEKAFPHIFKARYGQRGEASEAELSEAVHAELKGLISASWRVEHVKRRTDLESAVAASMDAPPRLVRRWAQAAEESGGTKPKGGKRTRKRK